MIEYKLNTLIFTLNENNTRLLYNPKNSNISVINSNLFKLQFVKNINKEIVINKIEYITYIGRNRVNCSNYPSYYDNTNLNIIFTPTEITKTIFTNTTIPYWYYTGNTKFIKHSYFYNDKNYTMIPSQLFSISDCSSFLNTNKYYSQYISININYNLISNSSNNDSNLNLSYSFIFKVKKKKKITDNNNNNNTNTNTNLKNKNIFWLFYGCSISYTNYELIILDKLYKILKRKRNDPDNLVVYKKIKNC